MVVSEEALNPMILVFLRRTSEYRDTGIAPRDYKGRDYHDVMANKKHQKLTLAVQDSTSL